MIFEKVKKLLSQNDDNTVKDKVYPCGPDCSCDAWICIRCGCKVTHQDHPDDSRCEDCLKRGLYYQSVGIKFTPHLSKNGYFITFKHYKPVDKYASI